MVLWAFLSLIVQRPPTALQPLTPPPAIMPTSPLPSVWRPNPGRSSTYPGGNSVQLTKTSVYEPITNNRSQRGLTRYWTTSGKSTLLTAALPTRAAQVGRVAYSIINGGRATGSETTPLSAYVSGDLQL